MPTDRSRGRFRLETCRRWKTTWLSENPTPRSRKNCQQKNSFFVSSFASSCTCPRHKQYNQIGQSPNSGKKEKRNEVISAAKNHRIPPFNRDNAINDSKSLLKRNSQDELPSATGQGSPADTPRHRWPAGRNVHTSKKNMPQASSRLFRNSSGSAMLMLWLSRSADPKPVHQHACHCTGVRKTWRGPKKMEHQLPMV